MSASNPYIARALESQDLERMKFAQNLRKNPEEYNNYVQGRIDSISNEIFNRKRTAFQKAHIDLARYMDMDHNANFYKSRSGDVDRLADAIGVNNQRIIQELERDKDVSKRQFEINEWYNYNKLETLFFLQLFFISTLCMVVIIYFQKAGTINNQIAAVLTAILCVVVVVTGVYRWRYTNKTRDPRLWHRRDFGKIKAVAQKAECGAQGGDGTFDLNAYLPEAVTVCADQVITQTSQKFDKWQKALQNEMSDYQTGGKIKTLNAGSQICDAFDEDNYDTYNR